MAQRATPVNRYKNEALGEIAVLQDHGKTSFDFGEFTSQVATLKNPDGTISFETIEPGIIGLDFVAGEAAGKPTLILRDGQHEYVFTVR